MKAFHFGLLNCDPASIKTFLKGQIETKTKFVEALLAVSAVLTQPRGKGCARSLCFQFDSRSANLHINCFWRRVRSGFGDSFETAIHISLSLAGKEGEKEICCQVVGRSSLQSFEAKHFFRKKSCHFSPAASLLHSQILSSA